MTTTQMIDVTRMNSLYKHLDNNPEIERIFQVFGSEEDLASVGQWAIDGNLKGFVEALESGMIRELTDRSIAPNTAVKCLYLPPYYFFINLNKIYE